MAILRAATHELRVTANGWHTLASELPGTAPTVPGLSFQPSAAAVAAIHAAVATASGVIAARTVNTAVKTTTAATAYTANEENSAAMIIAIRGAL
jgi:hypothetical protein